MRSICGTIVAIATVGCCFVASCVDLGGLNDSAPGVDTDGSAGPDGSDSGATSDAPAGDSGIDAPVTSDMRCASEVCQLPARECCLQQYSAAAARCIDKDRPQDCVPQTDGAPVGFGRCDEDGDCAAQGKPGAKCCGTKSGSSFISLECTFGPCSDHLCDPANAPACASTETCGAVQFYPWLHVCQPL